MDGQGALDSSQIGDTPIRADASPAYRGYRRQALYTLSRVLEPNGNELTFQPEGIEDLAIFASGQLVEAIQVKSLNNSIVLSHLVSTRRESSFLHRAIELVKSDSPPRITLATFGPLGSELDQAFSGDLDSQLSVSRKLTESYGMSAEDASAVLAVISPQLVNEENLTERVFAFLREAVTGADPEAAFNLLTSWLYWCAEHKCMLSRQDIIDRVNRVGRYIAENSARHAVWFASVVPIEERHLEAAERDALGAEFYRGVKARYDHILADVDIRRPEKIDQISAAFDERMTVILHAASGQGKSTIAYRYLRDEMPYAWRCLVQAISDRDHAHRIALALEGLANALDAPIVVFVDVAPFDHGWVELVSRLTLHQHMRVLVAVREEDWRRARFIDTDVFREVDLELDQREAEQMYATLAQAAGPPSFLNFDDAWTHFGGGGPLLEFVYLITQGGPLRERLADQVTALKRDANRGARGDKELELLRLVSVVSAFDGRLSVRALADVLGLPSLDEALNLLEGEYLIRRSDDRAFVAGLHPVRSEILAELFTDQNLYPWSDSAVAALTLLDERDVASFLLHSFSRRRPDIAPLLVALAKFHPKGWIGIAGVLRALIWLGLREYADANAELIADAKRDSGPGWWVVLDTDVAAAMPNIGESLSGLLKTLAKERRIAEIAEFRARQAPKESVYLRTKTWLQSRCDPPEPPSSVEEWLAASISAFWVGFLDIGWPLTDWLPREVTANASKTLPLDAAADLVAGLSEGYDDHFPGWMEEVRPALVERFQRELLTPLLEDNGVQLKAHFLIPPEYPESSEIPDVSLVLDSKNALHNEALVRVDLMRRLFPDREEYGCQGYGHGAVLLHLPSDDTRKAIPRTKLPLHWQSSINATFAGIVDFDTRPSNWADYGHQVMRLREEVVRCLEYLRKALPTYLRSSRSQEVKIPSQEWYKVWTLLRDPPHLPQSAVDEWGFVYEGLRDSENENSRIVRRTGLAQIPGVRRYQHIVEATNAYARPLENFLLQAPTVMEANRRVSKNPKSKEKRSSSKSIHWESEGNRGLSTHNLAHARIALPDIQRQFRRMLGSFVERQRLDTLERRETELFAEVWPLWFCYALQPDQVLAQPALEATALLERTTRNLNKALEKELRRNVIPDISVLITHGESSWDADSALWLTVDGENGVQVYNATDTILDAVLRAISSLPDNELRRYALDFYWRRIVVVPLIQGKSLSGTAWSVHTGLLVRAGNLEQLGWVHLQMHPIPKEAMVEHGLELWDDQDLAPATKLAEATDRIWPLVLYMAEFSQLPEIHGVGEELAIFHVREMMVRVNAATQSVFDAVGELASAIGDASNERAGGSAESIMTAFEAVKMLYEMVLPTKGYEKDADLKVRDFGPWSERLREGLRYALIAQLSWASVVLKIPQREPESLAAT